MFQNLYNDLHKFCRNTSKTEFILFRRALAPHLKGGTLTAMPRASASQLTVVAIGLAQLPQACPWPAPGSSAGVGGAAGLPRPAGGLAGPWVLLGLPGFPWVLRPPIGHPAVCMVVAATASKQAASKWQRSKQACKSER